MVTVNSIIFEMGEEFWIETVQISGIAVASQGNTLTTITLRKPGTLLGASMSMGQTTNTNDIVTQLTVVGGGVLTLGSHITQAQMRLLDVSATAETNCDAFAVFFMRKTQ